MIDLSARHVILQTTTSKIKKKKMKSTNPTVFAGAMNSGKVAPDIH